MQQSESSLFAKVLIYGFPEYKGLSTGKLLMTTLPSNSAVTDCHNMTEKL